MAGSFGADIPSYNHSVPKSLGSHYLEELAAEEQSQEKDITRAPIYSAKSGLDGWIGEEIISESFHFKEMIPLN